MRSDSIRFSQLEGAWALVTGASAGIGNAFCLQWAQAGVPLVVVAWREDRLQALARALHAQDGVKCVPLRLDLSAPESVPSLKARVEHERIRIRLLINNAAITQHGATLLEECRVARLEASASTRLI